MIAVYLVTKAYVAHFWYFEIKNRKLGCSFKEWLHGDIEQKQQGKG
jgi:intracellular multiplication protein IcmV